MKQIVLMGVLTLALPLAAFANNVDFGNSGGSLTGSSGELTLGGSQLTSVGGLGNGFCYTAIPCGSMAFTTGALISGNESTGAVFGAGGTFVIMGKGTAGIPNGVIFSRTFSGHTAWTPSGIVGVDGSIYYTLSGAISGTWYSGTAVNGATTQLTFDTGKSGLMGSESLGSGDTVITTTPEPGTLGLLGTGLVSLAAMVWRKLNTGPVWECSRKRTEIAQF